MIEILTAPVDGDTDRRDDPPPTARKEAFVAPFRGRKYLSLETFKRDGTPVQTPVWFLMEDERIYCRSWDETFKVKRFLRNPNVNVAPCNVRNDLKAAMQPARVQPVPESENERLRKLFMRRFWIAYPWELWVLKPSRDRKERKGGKRWGKELFYEIKPRDEVSS